MHPLSVLFYVLLGLTAAVPLAFAAAGTLRQIREGKFGSAAGLLAVALIVGLCFHQALAIVSSVLLGAAWIAATINRTAEQISRKLSDAEVRTG